MRGFGLALLVTVLAFLLAARGHAGVIVVGPGLPVSQISQAVAHASDGDVVLVKTGLYNAFTINNKSIAVVADAGAFTNISGIRVLNLAAGKTVLLDRMVSIGDYQAGTYPNGLSVSACAGSVRIQACQFEGAVANGGVSGSGSVAGCEEFGESDGAAAVTISGSADVAIELSKMQGGKGAYMFAYCPFDDRIYFGGYAGHGLRVQSSNVTVHTTESFGGNSGSGHFAHAAADGIWASGSNLLLVNVKTYGGHGGDSLDSFTPWFGGEGGFGLNLASNSLARVLDSHFEGGTQGKGFSSPGGAINDPISVDPSSTLTNWSGEAALVGCFKVVREGQSLVIQLAGQPGDPALLFAAPKSIAPLLVAPWKGAFYLDPALLLGPFAVGTVQGSAPLNISVPIPQLPPGVQHVGFYLQGALGSGAGTTITNWAHTTLLDAAL